MAKLSADQKQQFKESKDCMKDAVFMFDRTSGRSYMAEYTSSMENHARLVVSYCGKNDTFKKKIGFIECASKLAYGCGVVLPTNGSTLEEMIDVFNINVFGCYNTLETL